MKTTNPTPNPEAAIWERAIQFENGLSPTAARALLKLRFAQHDLEQMDALAAKARAGTLTPAEQVDLDTYERLGCFLDILHSKARGALKERRTAS
jgi:hypothetical protein